MIKQFFKKVLISYLIIICCVFTPAYRAYAVSAVGWSFSAYNPATSVLTAMKNGAAASVAVAKSPITSKIAKGIAGGVIVGAALPLAISQISGIALTAVDWVLDPANNAIKYRDKTKPGVLDSSNCSTQYWGQGSLTDLQARARSATGAKTLVLFLKPNDSKLWVKNWGEGESTVGTCSGITEQPQPYSTIPIPTVADKIYDNAKTDSASASVVNQAVKEYVNEGSADTALDAAKADADATHNCGTGTHWSGSACVADTPSTPTTPDTPDTPFDPSSIIDAINSVFNAITDLFDAVMSIPDVINTAIDKVLDAIESITDVINTAIDDLLIDIKDFFQPVIDSFTDFVDWVKEEPTPENPTKPDVTTLPTPPTDSVNISFDGGCPAPKVIAWSLAGRNVDITIPYTPICDTATLLNPLIKLAASLGAVFIVAGIRRGDDG